MQKCDKTVVLRHVLSKICLILLNFSTLNDLLLSSLLEQSVVLIGPALTGENVIFGIQYCTYI